MAKVAPTERPGSARERSAHRRAIEMTFADVARFLADVFGNNLTAYMAKVSSPDTVKSWAGGQEPRHQSEARLRNAMQIFQLIREEESDHVARAWFIGLNPQLDNRSPAEAIREGQFGEAMEAARAFIVGG